MEKEFSSELIEDAAASLFWTLAARNDFRHTLDNVPRSGGQSLLDCPDKEAVFAGYNRSELPDKVFADFCNEVVRHSYRKSANEENLIGRVYQEDILSDRSPPLPKISIPTLLISPLPFQVITCGHLESCVFGTHFRQ
ncbi:MULTISPECIES: hypothetical protein [Yersinia]|uniref:Uncharacterized protein n=2 Tax=Yersinia TaxID=629 RepID=A0AAD2V1A1_YEREN|nr:MULTISPECIES: hypothetical protein [Yersinia]EKN6067051.1 hypothetical protein [Yersinia enterocolitica]ELI8102987.1 hypothetical protein [Yersinia enterocolitica]ELI8338325.1 hypothetical protein [Yersinia enterocolitica]CNK90365.1 Uncharacterised protein [Yersinia aleksiciae]CQQ50439.1 Uncharacterised protein [Yersinia enterocolitica]